MAETLVQLRNLKKSYKTKDGPFFAVKGIDLDIHTGEIFSLLGPNGAGKTTTISMMSGLTHISEGTATIGGHSITEDPIAAKRLLGVVPQEIALYGRFTARQNLAYFGRLYGIGGAELDARIDEVLAFVDLTDRQNDRVETFSGGMKRRVNIGVGLLHRPKLVYMDEPTVGIDPQNRRRVLDTVFRLRDDYGMTVLYTTHLMEEAEEISDRVGIIDHGEIIALGTVDELTRRVGELDRVQLTVQAESVQQATVDAIVAAVPNVERAMLEPTVGSDEPTAVTALTIFCVDGRSALPGILSHLNGVGLAVVSVSVREPDLEAVFLDLTGRALRD